VEDDFIDQQALAFAVKEAALPWSVLPVSSIREARDRVRTDPFDVVIADYRLGDGTALDLLPDLERLPMIVVTGFGDEEIAVQALKAGAYDYLIKDQGGQYLKMLPVVVEAVLRHHHLEMAEHEQRTLAMALQDTAIALTSTLELNEVLNRILLNVQKVAHHDRACIILLEGDQACIAQCSDEYLRRPERYCLHEIEHLSRMCQTREPCLIPDLKALPPHLFFTDLRMMNAYMAVPIVTNDEVIGFISLESHQPGDFTPVVVERLRAFVAQAAVAIENARLHQHSVELAALHERQQIARDLHDSVTQTLFSAATVADAAITLWRKDPTQIKQELLDLHNLTRGALAEMRTLLFELRPDMLAAASLHALLQQLLDTLAGRTSIMVEFNALPHIPTRLIPADVKDAFFRITQEALNNVVKHARAPKVRVDLLVSDTMVLLRIVDDGRGFNPLKTSADHLGLRMMQERAGNAGIDCQVQSYPGSGTEVTMIWKPR
jgi:signal transduction histidine kinase